MVSRSLYLLFFKMKTKLISSQKYEANIYLIRILSSCWLVLLHTSVNSYFLVSPRFSVLPGKINNKYLNFRTLSFRHNKLHMSAEWQVLSTRVRVDVGPVHPLQVRLWSRQVRANPMSGLEVRGEKDASGSVLSHMHGRMFRRTTAEVLSAK